MFLVFLLGVNATNVHSYGEMGVLHAFFGPMHFLTLPPEYILSSLKVITIIAFVIVGTLVNAGVNRDHRLIGFSNWRVGDAPFVSWPGFGRVFVTASFACAYSVLPQLPD